MVTGRKGKFRTFGYLVNATFAFIGSATVALALGYPAKALADYSQVVSPNLTHLLVALEYKEASACPNVPPDAKVTYLDRGLVSVVQPGRSGGFSFSVISCGSFDSAAGAGGRQPPPKFGQ